MSARKKERKEGTTDGMSSSDDVPLSQHVGGRASPPRRRKAGPRCSRSASVASATSVTSTASVDMVDVNKKVSTFAGVDSDAVGGGVAGVATQVVVASTPSTASTVTEALNELAALNARAEKAGGKGEEENVGGKVGVAAAGQTVRKTGSVEAVKGADATVGKSANRAKGGNQSAAELIKSMKAISDRLLDLAIVHDVPTRPVVTLSNEYEVLLLGLVSENERLRGRVEAMSARPILARAPVQVTTAKLPPPVPAPVPAPVREALPAKKPVETWSLVVRSRNKEVTAKEVVAKVVDEVGPTLGVRVHEVKPIRGGGAIIAELALWDEPNVMLRCQN